MPDRNGNPTETEISKEIGEFLTLNRIPNWRAQVLKGLFKGHGEKKMRHVETGKKGMSDRQFPLDDGSGQTVYLEVKKPGGKQSQDQKDFEKMCIQRNVPYFIAESVQDVAQILEVFGMLRARM